MSLPLQQNYKLIPIFIMNYRFSGKSGLQLPLVSLGLWHNFGSEDPADVARAQRLGAIAAERGQTLAQMAISWLLAQDVTSVIVGARSVKQLDDNLQAISNIQFTAEEMELIKTIG